jgi:hypothetical protein
VNLGNIRAFPNRVRELDIDDDAKIIRQRRLDIEKADFWRSFESLAGIYVLDFVCCG